MIAMSYKPKLGNQILHLPSSKGTRKLLVFFVFLLSVVLVSSILCAFSLIICDKYGGEGDNGVNGVFRGRRFFSTAILARTVDDVLQDPSFFCDRSHHRTDVCTLKGDVRADGRTATISVYAQAAGPGVKEEEMMRVVKEEVVRPYTRKWEASVMENIDEVRVRKVIYNSAPASKKNTSRTNHSDDQSKLRQDHCDVRHAVPAVVFSTGGYTGNVYHEFNDGLVPLFITTHRFKGEVVWLVLEYHEWWMTKYAEVVGQLTHHEVVNFSKDRRVHCFPEVIVGLQIQDELTIDPRLATTASSSQREASTVVSSSPSQPGPPTMAAFQALLRRAYIPRLQSTAGAQPPRGASPGHVARPGQPKLVLVSRASPRAILNEAEVIRAAQRVGFHVEVLAPRPTTEMVDIYAALQSCHVMLGVHGAAMTHLLYLRPGTTFIQVVPLGTDWAARTYYGEPAVKMGLDYVAYEVLPEESSLSERYASDDPVLTDPESVNRRGWWETKRVYLEGQDLRLSLPRITRTLLSAYNRTAALLQPRHRRQRPLRQLVTANS